MATATVPNTLKDFDQQHAAISEFAGRSLQTTHSTFLNGVSSHRLKSPVSFAMLNSFATAVGTHTGNVRLPVYLGSVNGELVVSTQLQRTELADVGTSGNATSGQKRSRFDYDCEVDRAGQAHDDTVSTAEADQAITRMRARVTPQHGVPDGAFDTALAALRRVMKMLRGARGEVVLESAGLTLMPQPVMGSGSGSGNGSGNGPYTPAAAGADTSPRHLVVLLRLAAGVAVPLRALRYALGPCFADGVITTTPETAPLSATDLPISEAGKMHEQEEGQRTLVVMASVPNPKPERADND